MLLLSLPSAPLLGLSSSSIFLRATHGRCPTFLLGPLKSRNNNSDNDTSLPPRKLNIRRLGGRWSEQSSPSRLHCRAQLYDQLAPTASAVYGTLLLGGGLFAYVRSGSKGSIIGGAAGAVLMATAYFLMQAPGTRDIGDAFAFGSALLFSAVFGIRLAATRKLIPSGLLLGLSVCALAIFFSSYMHDKYIINDPLIM
ncbi:protein FATTY ACID EXPORT 4, chloroplastic [Nymphaea colorata]|uniref:protein FATTY ACID EXPORT 4, chloroplastic n=1 Tax=Nymphaea colorata TaxID=210225 RepID=UPI00129DACF7|nr:protein FATTY ACID EXPORT 4, chloroplastic [Nymphaea colorata]